jgi:cation:H+ antiporter
MSTGFAAVLFAGSLVVTLYAASVFADRLDRLGSQLGLPEALLGLLTAAGADAPELASAVAAIASGAKGVGFGVVIGSNVFNLGAMLGLSAIVAGSVTLRRDALALEGGVALAVTGIVALLGFGVLPPWATVVLAATVLAPYVVVIARAEREHSPLLGEQHRRRPESGQRLLVPAGVIAVAVAVIVLGSIGMVHAALRLGDAAGMPRVLVGTLLLAVLTSIPNAYTGVRLGRAGRGSALVAETLNSNTINLVGGIALPALFVSLGSGFTGLERADVVWLLVTTGVAILLLGRGRGLARGGGFLLAVGWIAFAVIQGAVGG